MSEPKPVKITPTPSRKKAETPSVQQATILAEIPVAAPPAPPILSVAPTRSAVAVQQAPLSITEISQMGGTTLVKTAAISGKITSVAKAGDMDELGKLVGQLLIKAKEYDPSKLGKGGILGWFRKSKQQLLNHYQTVDQQVGGLVIEVDKRVGFFRGRVADLEEMFNANEEYHEELGQTIAAMQERVEWMRSNQPVVDEADAFSAQKAADWQQVITFAEKRIDDLRRGQMLSEQTGPQIKLMAMNSIALSQTFDDIKVTTIPTLQRTFALYIINKEQQQGADMAEAVRNTTNAAIIQNADLLKSNTSKVHTQLSRSNIDMKTLEHNQQAVFDSLKEVERIRAEMKSRLQSEAPKIERLSADLHTRMAEYGRALPGGNSAKQIEQTATF
jgi:uncharacterized protein YaaN involved in tellurite resistance